MQEAYLLLGSNQGDRLQWLQQAICMLALLCGNLLQKSSVYETAPWGLEAQPHFLNLALLLETDKSPEALLESLQDIEEMLGRRRAELWGPRTLDIDILTYGNEVMHTEKLTIPHLFLHKRRFALAPLAEIAPNFVHPQLHKTIATLLAECSDPLSVCLYDGFLAR
jgi:2-amino-4-hydroxy-6-hydroxymethyldihydropteridine diphosphokinase